MAQVYECAHLCIVNPINNIKILEMKNLKMKKLNKNQTATVNAGGLKIN